MASKGRTASSGKTQTKARPVAPTQRSQAQLKAQLSAVQRMLSTGVSNTSAFDWGQILASQPEILNQLQSGALANLPVNGAPRVGAPADLPTGMGFTKDKYPPNLYYPFKFNSDYPPIVLHFYVVLWDLLDTVRIVFHECLETPRIMKMLEENIHPDPRLLRIGVSEYYDAMKPYFNHVERRDPSFLPHATELPFFDTMRLADKLTDPDLDQDDIVQFMIRIERLNALSELHCLVPGAIFNLIYEVAYDHLQQNARPTPSFDEATNIATNLLHRIPEKELSCLFEDKDRVMVIVNNFGKLKDLPGMMNLAPIAEQIMDLLSEPDMI